jgi:hypothetical protein
LIATSSVARLVKEEASYHAELAKQEARLQKALANPDSGDENAEFAQRQEVCFPFLPFPSLPSHPNPSETQSQQKPGQAKPS